MQYEVNVDTAIQRFNSGSYISQSRNQGTVTVNASSINQAQRLVSNMFGGYNNCQVRSVHQK